MISKKIERRDFVKVVGGGVVATTILAGIGRKAFGQAESICRQPSDLSDVPPYDPHIATSGDAKYIAAALCNGLVRNPPYNPTIDPK